MKNYKQLDNAFEGISKQIRDFENTLNEESAPEETKEAARKTLERLKKERDEILRKIQK